uniref:L1 transposable element RRM domain-containing protein n=1 Tax=Kryptolebias marmoratus TaxID=37003 RepID=A0A3Q3AGT8_KRYMA
MKLAANSEANQTRLTSLEEATNSYSDKVTDLEKQIGSLKEEVKVLTDKTEDLEGRQRRCNIRILGVREKIKAGSHPSTAVAKLLQDILGLDSAPTLDHAHRGMQSVSPRDNRPRPFIVKFHYYQEKLEVLRMAAKKGPLHYKGDTIMIFPDLPAAVVKRRGFFKGIKDQLRKCPNVKFGMLYPARLKITSSAGEEIFTDPAAAEDYVKKILMKGYQHDRG